MNHTWFQLDLIIDGKDKLKVMENTKLIQLKEFLDRNAAGMLESCIEAVGTYEIVARWWYSMSSHSSDDDFVEMMVLDGCYLLGLLRKINLPEQPKKDIIVDTLCIDLLGIENQVPFFILVELFHRTNSSSDTSSKLNDLAQKLTYTIPAYGRKESLYNVDDDEVNHLLDLVYRACTSSFAAKLTTKDTSIRIADPDLEVDRFSVYYISSASELRETNGVKFKYDPEGLWLDITWDDGVIKIPHFIVDVHTERLLRNLIAYEQHYNLHNMNRRHYITDYAIFMDRLINSARDVEVLRHSKIIINKLNDDQAVCDMFSRLTRDIYTGQDFCYAGVFSDVEKYAKSRWHIWWTKLMRTYFNSPWSFISFVAATVALILTFLQTLYTISPV